jgi:hypothetical protein
MSISNEDFRNLYTYSGDVSTQKIHAVVPVDLATGKPIFPAPSALIAIQSASDAHIAISYLNQGTADERISTVVFSSASLSQTITLTLGYTGSSGSYSVSTVQYS